MINLFNIEVPVYTPRISTDNWAKNYPIKYYDIDNLYPQRMKEIMNGSSYIKSCVNVIADFLNGEGWTQKGDTVINEYGQTFDDILELVALDYSIFKGFSLHFNFNGLGVITEIQYLPFEYVRLGLPNNRGIIDNVLVWDNWEESSYKNQNEGSEPLSYPLFNPLLAGGQTIRGGRGQVLYYTPKMFTYPLVSFDPVRDAGLTDKEIQTFMLANIKNGFLSTTLFKYPGTFQSDEEREKIEEKVRGIKGSYNANSITLVEMGDEQNQADIIEQIPANNNDRLFEQTGSKVMNTIIHNFAIPPALIGVMPDTGVFTQQAIRDSYIYMNTRTKTPRRTLERVFDKISPLFGVKLGKIKPNMFDYAGNPQQENQFTPEQNKSNSEESLEDGRTEDNSI